MLQDELLEQEFEGWMLALVQVLVLALALVLVLHLDCRSNCLDLD